MNTIDRFHSWRRKLRWDKQYKSGRWDLLKDESESVRYLTISEHIRTYGISNPDILALGCGEAILLDYLLPEDYNLFYGVDFSAISIEKAIKKQHFKAQFETNDVQLFEPKQKFDIIIFNEIFYYIMDSKKKPVLELMKSYLNPNGIIIVSMFRERPECWDFFQRKDLHTVDFKTVESEVSDKYWKIGVFSKKLQD